MKALCCICGGLDGAHREVFAFSEKLCGELVDSGIPVRDALKQSKVSMVCTGVGTLNLAAGFPGVITGMIP
jgi:hypothetical protein